MEEKTHFWVPGTILTLCGDQSGTVSGSPYRVTCEACLERNPALRFQSGPDGLEQERDALKASNAELLEALKRLLMHQFKSTEAAVEQDIAFARVAIAKAEGKP